VAVRNILFWYNEIMKDISHLTKLPFSLLIATFLFSCSTKRSQYSPYKKDEGYKDSKEASVRKTSFKGNEVTKAQDAEVFATFRAIELCQQENKKLLHVLDVANKTTKKDIIRQTGGYNPSYYYGMSPFYGRYSGFGMGIGMSTGSAWMDTLEYPEIEITFQCEEKVFGPRVVFRDVNAENMKLLVKDLKGGLQIEKILPGSPNEKQVEVGDIVLKMEGVRIERSQEIQIAFNREPRPQKLTLEILREGVKMKAPLLAVDITQDVQKCQDDMIRMACNYEEIKKNPLCH
jgi:hypothetical protein